MEVQEYLPLTETSFFIILSLATAPKHGYAIMKEVEIMSEKRVRHLVVRDDGRINGMVSIRDLLKAIIDDQQFTIEQLEHYISGYG